MLKLIKLPLDYGLLNYHTVQLIGVLHKYPLQELSDGKQVSQLLFVKSCARSKAVTQFVTMAGATLAKIILLQHLSKA